MASRNQNPSDIKRLDAESNFWTSKPSKDPKKRFNFVVEIDAFKFEDEEGSSAEGEDILNESNALGLVWYASSIDKPKLNIGTEEHMPYGHPTPTNVPYFDGWGPITLTMVDPTYPNATRKLLRIIRRSGWATPNREMGTNKLFDAGKFMKFFGEVRIHQLIDSFDKNSLDAQLRDSTTGLVNGMRVSETWSLKGAFPTQFDFGSLDYSSDELLEISLTIQFSHVKVEVWNTGEAGDSESGYTYFSDESDSSSDKCSVGFTFSGVK